MVEGARRHLVFGDDGSVGADVAWLWINSHCWTGWGLQAVTGTALLSDRDHTGSHPPLHEPRRPFAEADFTWFTHARPEQDPRFALCIEADLIVIGTRGPGVLKALHLGSTAEWLAIRPPAPLLIARHGHPTHTVLLAHDGSPDAWAVTTALTDLPFAGQLSVTVVVVDDGVIDSDAILDRATQSIEISGAKVSTRRLTGDPCDTLGELVQRSTPDVVAVGTRGRLRTEHLRLGSVSRSLVHTPCSVLIARRRPEPAHIWLRGSTAGSRDLRL
jgi:nucleotide-binding universal stress UspA family protein